MIGVTAASVHLPDTDLGPVLTELAGPGGWPESLAGTACPPERAATLLGRRGLLMKEPATRLALCATHRALGLAPGPVPPPDRDPGTAVVAAVNLGNVETVADLARTVEREGYRAASPLTAPNASSNVVATTVARWFGFGGANLQVCSGAMAGADALVLAVLLLRAGRARRVALVGAEPADPVAADLRREGGAVNPRAGAACVVLTASGDGVPLELSDGEDREASIVVGPAGVDLVARWGDYYGAQDVVSLALAYHLTAAGVAASVTVRTGGRTAVLGGANAGS
ncbi:beta-ketoacyl synthase N-terminal-like domain-containing protein [Amycolatopsis minnesotensis]|uniref:Beta-ketoacyl synthase-like N-terminal domain-containing protein n=1 Tax=Amycolatopsis minnesotensis TaxID=337894 RepID=A0ABN2QLZ5_9PSEU